MARAVGLLVALSACCCLLMPSCTLPPASGAEHPPCALVWPFGCAFTAQQAVARHAELAVCVDGARARFDVDMSEPHPGEWRADIYGPMGLAVMGVEWDSTRVRVRLGTDGRELDVRARICDLVDFPQVAFTFADLARILRGTWLDSLKVRGSGVTANAARRYARAEWADDGTVVSVLFRERGCVLSEVAVAGGVPPWRLVFSKFDGRRAGHVRLKMDERNYFAVLFD